MRFLVIIVEKRIIIFKMEEMGFEVVKQVL